MNIAIAATGFLVVVLSAAVGGPSLSSVVFSPESRFTSVAADRCLADRADRPDRSQCPGLGGARVLVSRGEGRIGLGFAWSSRQAAEQVVTGAGLEPDLEWRGVATAHSFEPHAVLARVTVRREGVARPAIAVMRIGGGQACLIGLVDREVVGADGVARRLADDRFRAQGCGTRLSGTAPPSS